MPQFVLPATSQDLIQSIYAPQYVHKHVLCPSASRSGTASTPSWEKKYFELLYCIPPTLALLAAAWVKWVSGREKDTGRGITYRVVFDTFSLGARTYYRINRRRGKNQSVAPFTDVLHYHHHLCSQKILPLTQYPIPYLYIEPHSIMLLKMIKPANERNERQRCLFNQQLQQSIIQ